MAGRKKKSAEPKKELFTPLEKENMLLELVGSIVGDKGVKGFILMVESDTQDHIRIHGMNNVTALGYSEKLGLLLKNRMLIDMAKGDTNEDDKPKQRRKKKTGSN